MVDRDMAAPARTDPDDLAPTPEPSPPDSATHAAPVRRREPRTPFQAWARAWPLAIVLAAAGVAGGLAESRERPLTYTSEARVAVGQGDLSSGAIAGFPLAAQELASNYARYINDNGAQSGGGVSLSASPIPDSNIIRIQGASTDPNGSRLAVDKASRALINQVNKPSDNGALYKRYSTAADVWAKAQTAQARAQSKFNRALGDPTSSSSDVRKVSGNLTRATAATQRAELQMQTLFQQYQSAETASDAARLQLVLPAQLVANNQSSLRQRFALLGGAAGLGLSFVLAVVFERWRSRRRRRRLG